MGEPKPVNFRHELKYLISSAEVTMLRTRLSGLISLDAHAKNGHYTIRSLYFDDYDDRCLLENENGTDPREKFRIRIYNGSAERISLECKRKERGMTHKTSCPLTREQTELLMAGKIVPNVADRPPLLQKLTAQMMTRRLQPRGHRGIRAYSLRLQERQRPHYTGHQSSFLQRCQSVPA